MEPREGFEIVELGPNNPPQDGDVLVAGGVEYIHRSNHFAMFDTYTKYTTFNYGMKVYRPIIKDAKDEEIEFLRRVADQAVDATALRILRSAGGVCNEIEMCGEYYKAASDVPDLYKYLLDRENSQ
jgi:hypothetical protein